MHGTKRARNGPTGGFEPVSRLLGRAVKPFHGGPELSRGAFKLFQGAVKLFQGAVKLFRAATKLFRGGSEPFGGDSGPFGSGPRYPRS
jgi:hypothetical protein